MQIYSFHYAIMRNHMLSLRNVPSTRVGNIDEERHQRKMIEKITKKQKRQTN